MTRPTVPAVSTEAQAVRGWPRPGTRVRVTRTHTSGLVETTDGVAADGGWDEDRTTYWLMLNEGAGEVALSSDDVWTVTWEELEPVPSPVLPPEPPVGAYVIDCEGDIWRHVDTDSWKCLTEHLHRRTWKSLLGAFDPVEVLRPVSEVVDRADAQELAERLLWHVRRRHNDECHPDCLDDCSDRCEVCGPDVALLARFDAPGAV